jgi:hypothetical protein
MDILDAVTDYLGDLGHLGKKSQAGYRQRLAVFHHVGLQTIKGIKMPQLVSLVKGTD